MSIDAWICSLENVVNSQLSIGLGPKPYSIVTSLLTYRGFVAYIKGAPNYNLEMYKQLVNEITTTFKNISLDILHIEELLQSNNRSDLSDSLRKIQSLEQEKLALVRAHYPYYSYGGSVLMGRVESMGLD